MKYIDEPGDVTVHVPALPEGAWTDDDTDFEWVYIAMSLDAAEPLRSTHPEAWCLGVAALQAQSNVLQALFHHSPVPSAVPLRERFIRAGVVAPREPRALWP